MLCCQVRYVQGQTIRGEDNCDKHSDFLKIQHSKTVIYKTSLNTKIRKKKRKKKLRQGSIRQNYKAKIRKKG